MDAIEALMQPGVLPAGNILAALRPPWMRKANCRGVSQDLFFQARGKVDDAWRAVCAGCVVSGDCLAYAMADASIKGFWAGTSEGERRRMRAARRVA